MNRRNFLQYAAAGAGATMMTPMLSGQGGVNQGVLANPHFKGKAKRVIFLTMSGGPSQFESFDYKPTLAKYHGKTIPDSYTKGQELAQLQGQKLLAFGPQFKFKKYGQSGQEICELFPHLGSVADDLAIIRSAHTDQINHDPAMTVLNTGTFLNGRPGMGAWANYALGSECKDLPGFVVMESVKGRGPQPIYSRLWHSGFLPSVYQGVKFNSKGDAVHYVRNPHGVGKDAQKELLQTINKMNKIAQGRMDDPEIATRIRQYEMAFRMQESVPQLMDVSKEPQHVLDMYGCKPGDGSFASNCLLARKLAEKGVRFIQLYHRGWDHHDGIKKWMPVCAKAVDQGAAALIKDLKQRGMLEDTLIIWGGEFGRTPMSQGGSGRDHHKLSMSMFMAGGGIKGGLTYGETDELGYKPAVDPVHVRDIHATMMHQLGIDHSKLTYRFQGLDNRLTGVEHAKVLKKLLV